MTLPFSHPLLLWPAAALALLALALGLRAQLAPGLGVRVAGQRPLLQGLGLALLLGGVGAGLAEPRWGAIEAPRLTVHVVLDASRSMRVPDCAGASRWRAAAATLDRLWSSPNPGVRFSLLLLTGDAIPVLPAGEDQTLLRDALRAVDPGAIGSPGTAFGHGLTQAAALAEPAEPAVVLLLSDGEETVETPPAALQRALAALRAARLPLYAMAFGQPSSQPVPGAEEALSSTARPGFLQDLAEGAGGRMLRPGEDPAALFQALAQGHEPMPRARSLVPAHPEWGAWLALAGLALWLLAAGKPMRAWRPILVLALAVGLAGPARALPVPASVQAWAAQTALARGNLDAARRWRPQGGPPGHRLLAAQIDLRCQAWQDALDILAPLTAPSVPRPLPSWRAPAQLMAARALVQLERPEAARALLEHLLLEQPGHPEAGHDLQTLLKDPPPPGPRKPPPRPSQGASQDELEGLRQRLPGKTPPPAGVKDL